MKNSLFVINVLIGLTVSAQNTELSPPLPPEPPTEPVKVEESRDDLEIVDFPEVSPEFPGGYEAIKTYISNNLEYPEKSKENMDEGRIYVSFIVEIDGSISNVAAMHGGQAPELNAEAIRVVKGLKEWVPATDEGQKVRSRCRLPITFSLTVSEDESPKRKRKRKR